MMNPHPHLYRVDGRPLPGLPRRVQSEVTRACREIKRRTGYQAWYHAPQRAVQYHRGTSPRYGATQDVLHTAGRYHPISVESACKRIGRSRMRMDRKLAVMKQSASDRTTAKDKAIHSKAVDISGSLVDEIKYRMRKAQDPHSTRVFPMFS